LGCDEGVIEKEGKVEFCEAEWLDFRARGDGGKKTGDLGAREQTGFLCCGGSGVLL